MENKIILCGIARDGGRRKCSLPLQDLLGGVGLQSFLCAVFFIGFKAGLAKTH